MKSSASNTSSSRPLFPRLKVSLASFPAARRLNHDWSVDSPASVYAPPPHSVQLHSADVHMKPPTLSRFAPTNVPLTGGKNGQNSCYTRQSSE